MIDFKSIPSPCFVLEETKLRKNLTLIKRVATDADVTIILALKGFAMYSVFDIVKEYLPGTTASSLNELKLAHEEFGDQIHGYATIYLPEEIEEWSQKCQHITFNSLAQFEKYKMACSSNSLGLRINPEYSEVTTDLYNPCVSGSRLGIRANVLGSELPEGVDGLHFHTLCENNSITLENTLKAVDEKFGHLFGQIKWLNLGGGHLITEKNYDVAHLIELLKVFKIKYPHLEIIMEPGSAIAWETGCLVSTVHDKFDSDGIESVILDISIAAHMPDCIEMPYTPKVMGAEIITPTRTQTPNQTQTRLGGTSCLAGDFVGDYHFPQGLEIGDKVIFEDMMHYTMVKTTFFNGVNHPSIGIWRDNNTFELVKRFDYEQFKNKLS